MALNIAVPMSGVGDLLEGFGLLSPISPVSIGFHSNIKTPLSPVGSESSGVSSLDLEDIKKQIPSSPTLTDENEEASASSSGSVASPSDSSSLCAATTISTTSSRTCSTSSSSSSSPSSSNSDDDTNLLEENEEKQPGESRDSDLPSSPSPTASLGSGVVDPNAILSGSPSWTEPLDLQKELPFSSPTPTTEPIYSVPQKSIIYGNRDILDLGSNLRISDGIPGGFSCQYAMLPVTNNIQFFLKNRSQYHRLGPNGHVQEFGLATCSCCDFQFPVNAVSCNSGANQAATQVSATLNLSSLNANQIYGNLQQQQQQQLLQHQQQQQRLRLQQQQQQQQMQYGYRFNNGNNGSNGNGLNRDFNMYQQSAVLGANGTAGGLQSSRFNNGVYGSGSVSSVAAGGTTPNVQTGNNGFYNNTALGNNLQGRDQLNQMSIMSMQQYNSIGANSKGISQPNSASAQPSPFRQQYDMLQQQKQYGNNYPLGVGVNSSTNSANVTTAARLQQQQQQQQSSQYYKKNQAMRFGGALSSGAGASGMLSSGPNGNGNWKNQTANNNTIQDTASKLYNELKKMQQQQSTYQNVPFQTIPFW
ncbi:probable serine/threonine-protein kinase yakA [Anopheles nili]|uniref:probable serine/threonine-protein kinase yakA n=1 Tax=Anopheles nili TaxID=185578 RepID=UPI00237C517B|nr:probable serine/threonine-protein kinase yakA [Anopheles nili]